MKYPRPFEIFIHEISKFPGIGKKNAEKLAFYIFLESEDLSIRNLTESILDMKKKVFLCKQCFFITESKYCYICQDRTRNSEVLCVVENSKTLINIEKTNEYRGYYHVLCGRISPLERISEKDIKISELMDRIENSLNTEKPIKEIIFACSPNLEGNMTELYIVEKIFKKNWLIKMTSLAKGVPMGASLEFADLVTLANSLNKREILK